MLKKILHNNCFPLCFRFATMTKQMFASGLFKAEAREYIGNEDKRKWNFLFIFQLADNVSRRVIEVIVGLFFFNFGDKSASLKHCKSAVRLPWLITTRSASSS